MGQVGGVLGFCRLQFLLQLAPLPAHHGGVVILGGRLQGDQVLLLRLQLCSQCLQPRLALRDACGAGGDALLLLVQTGGQGSVLRQHTAVLRVYSRQAATDVCQSCLHGVHGLVLFGLFPTTGAQMVAQFQQLLPERLRLVGLFTAAEAGAILAALQAASRHGAAALQQLPLQGHATVLPQEAARLIQGLEYQGLPQHVGKNLAIDRLKVNKMHSTVHQAL